MKWIYIVSWTLSTYVSAPCPDANKVDAFGRKSMFSCTVMHGHFTREDKSKSFEVREDAIDFIAEGYGIENLKLDSIKIK